MASSRMRDRRLAAFCAASRPFSVSAVSVRPRNASGAGVSASPCRSRITVRTSGMVQHPFVLKYQIVFWMNAACSFRGTSPMCGSAPSSMHRSSPISCFSHTGAPSPLGSPVFTKLAQ